MEKTLTRREVTDIESKANAIFSFKAYIEKQDWSQTFEPGQSKFCDAGDGWKAALEIKSCRGTPNLLLKNDQLDVSVSIGFRCPFNAILSGNFHDYITGADEESNLCQAILNLDLAITRTIEQNQQEQQETRRGEAEALSSDK